MREYLALPDGAGRFPQDFSGPAVLRDTNEPVVLHLQGYHLLWRRFPTASISTRGLVNGPYNPKAAETTLVWAIPLSLATTQGITIVFSSSGYLDVSVLRVRFHSLCIQLRMTGLQPAGLPHSEIYGSMLVCSSPQLIAAYHVLHRLLMPRHPPYALTCLNITFFTGNRQKHYWSTVHQATWSKPDNRWR